MHRYLYKNNHPLLFIQSHGYAKLRNSISQKLKFEICLQIWFIFLNSEQLRHDVISIKRIIRIQSSNKSSKILTHIDVRGNFVQCTRYIFVSVLFCIDVTSVLKLSIAAFILLRKSFIFSQNVLSFYSEVL